MREFNYEKLKTIKFDSEIINLLTSIHEAKGRQELYLSKVPQELDKLVEIAKAQSTEGSNAIEGIRTTETRFRQLMQQKTEPRNRNEEEISGYRDALNVIHESFEYIPITSNYILQLHQIMYKHVKECNFGGCYKNSQNYIQAIDDMGNAYTLFTPLAPFETPDAVDRLCTAYNNAVEENAVDALLLIPVFIHDFLCIHPFRDGNGRMSRLLTTLLLYRSGFYVGRYISLEAKIANIKDLYYDALRESQDNWHEAKDDPTPFIKYMLSIIDMAYRDFEDRMNIVQNSISASEMVKKAVESMIGKIRKSDIIELCPTLSVSAVEKGIAQLLKEGKILKLGSGKSTFYLRRDF